VDPALDQRAHPRAHRDVSRALARFFAERSVTPEFMAARVVAAAAFARRALRSGCPQHVHRVRRLALGGIGCHYMVTWMDRKTDTFTHMGGEGVTWSGQAPFTEEKHVFQNLGDGTYFHSGSLAIRQSVAAKVNITYKILYNDAVAMTGGRDGRHLGVP
jgi:indolepyruvate ferredoxin oxidoreductase